MSWLRFIKHLYWLRSVSAALWIMDYEAQKPPHQK